MPSRSKVRGQPAQEVRGGGGDDAGGNRQEEHGGVQDDPWLWGPTLGQVPRREGERNQAWGGVSELPSRPGLPEKRQAGGSEVLGPKPWPMLTLRSQVDTASSGRPQPCLGAPTHSTRHSQHPELPALRSGRADPGAPTTGSHTC